MSSCGVGLMFVTFICVSLNPLVGGRVGLSSPKITKNVPSPKNYENSLHLKLRKFFFQIQRRIAKESSTLPRERHPALEKFSAILGSDQHMNRLTIHLQPHYRGKHRQQKHQFTKTKSRIIDRKKNAAHREGPRDNRCPTTWRKERGCRKGTTTRKHNAKK